MARALYGWGAGKEISMDRVLIYWDISNIDVAGRKIAEEREEDRWRFRIDLPKTLRLAQADRPLLGRPYAAGSEPPEMHEFWDRLRGLGVDLRLFDRGGRKRPEQEMPDILLRERMLGDLADKAPGIVVLLTGDGKGYSKGEGFYKNLERMHQKGWRVELLSWKRSCHKRMRSWVEENGVFVPLDDFYEAITFVEPSKPGYPEVQGRKSAALDMSMRPRA